MIMTGFTAGAGSSNRTKPRPIACPASPRLLRHEICCEPGQP